MTAPLENDNGFSPGKPTGISAYLLLGAFRRLLSEKGLSAGGPLLSGSEWSLTSPVHSIKLCEFL